MAKNSTVKNPMKVITGEDTRWSFANVWEPKSINGGAPKYSVSLIIPKSDKALPNLALEVAAAAYCALEQWYNTHGYSTWDGKICKNKKLDVLYANLKKLGYQMSDEEIAWQQGKHPCFFDPAESGVEQ